MSLKKWICLLSISIAIFPIPLLCQMQPNSSGVEFITTISSFRERKEISSWLVQVLHKTWNEAFSRRSGTVTVKKCTKKCVMQSSCFAYSSYCMLFWRSRCRRRLVILNSLFIKKCSKHGERERWWQRGNPCGLASRLPSSACCSSDSRI